MSTTDLEARRAVFSPGLAIWHPRAKPAPYPFENSRRGLEHAARVGANAIDHDYQCSREGILINTHWAHPLRHGFVDPWGEISPAATISDLTVQEIGRLKARRGGYRIRTIGQDLEDAAYLDVAICAEVKVDPRFKEPETFRPARTRADTLGARLVFMHIQNLGGERMGAAILAAAQEAGHPVMLLHRGPIDWRLWGFIDAVKGPPGCTRGAPAHVIRLGTAFTNATRWGASCHDETARRTRAAIDKATRGRP